ncbi:3-hydroxyacyl-CoA dehydrogenase family protein [Actinokineospora sp. NPDC004072]
MRFRNVGVVGTGVIGVGVVQSLAQTGHRVVAVDLDQSILDCAGETIARRLKSAALFDPRLRAADHGEILARIDLTTDLDRLGEAEFVIENATEDWATKEAVYRDLDRVCAADAVLAANTSAISITRLAAVTGRPEQVIGMHFMNPVPQKDVVEVIRGERTSAATEAAAAALLEQMGKRGIVVNDAPGFVSNRVLMLTINEAVHVVQDGVAGAREVDEIFVRCFAHRMGPLATADLIGLDTVLRTLDVLRQGLADDKFRPCPLLRRMVDAGQLGRKAGKGFYDYPNR